MRFPCLRQGQPEMDAWYPLTWLLMEKRALVTGKIEPGEDDRLQTPERAQAEGVGDAQME